MSEISIVSNSSLGLSNPLFTLQPKRLTPIDRLNSSLALSGSGLTGLESRKRSHFDPLAWTPSGSESITLLSDSSGSQSIRKKKKFPTDKFSDLKRKASVLEEKCREVYDSLQQQVDQLEKDKQTLKLRERQLSQNLQKEKELSSTARNKLKEVEQRLKEAEENLKVKDERIRQLEQSNKHFENLRKTMQSGLDESYRLNKQEPLKWFAGLPGTGVLGTRQMLPKVTMKFLTGYVADFAAFWEELGMALDMENAVKAEQNQSITAKQKCLHVLQQWTTLSSASYPVLLDALSKLSQRPLAVRIEEDIRKEIANSNVKDLNTSEVELVDNDSYWSTIINFS